MSKLRQSSSYSQPAPIGGLNAIDSIAAMAETDAIVMRNMYPQSFGVGCRKGYKEFAAGLTGEVKTVMSYSAPTGEKRIFAIDNAYVTDITAGGVVPIINRVCAVTQGSFQFTTISNTISSYLMAFNGTDDGFLYSQTTGYHALVLGDGVTVWTWKNIDPKKLVQPVFHQHRVWAVEIGSTRAWYLPTDQVYGVATAFDFGGNYARGGYLQCLIPYTLDSSTGPNDYLAAVSSEGEIALYQGIDPSATTTWELVGVFYAGATFTRRCWTKFGGDAAILTQFGLLTLSAIIRPDPGYILGNPISQKIQRLFSQTISAAYSYEGWEIHSFFAENMLIVNVPGVAASQTTQFAYNSVTKAWTLFDNMWAQCWANTDVGLLFGEDGRVCMAWTGYQDNVPLGEYVGETIKTECQQAFSYFNMPGATKHFKMARPTFLHGGNFAYRFGANMNFDFTSIPPPATTPTMSYGVWDESVWDTTARWSGGVDSDKQWQSIIGLGYAASARIAVDASAEVIWVATDWLFEKGGVV